MFTLSLPSQESPSEPPPEPDICPQNDPKLAKYTPNLHSHSTLTTVIETLQTHPKRGLSTCQVEERKETCTENRLAPPPQRSALKMLAAQMKDFMVIILCIAAVVALSVEGQAEGGKTAAVLMTVVILNVIIGFTQERNAAKALNALKSLHVPQAMVIRDGNRFHVPSEDLVPGDIIIIEEGDAVPADLRLMETSQLEIIESILTGESVPVHKDTKPITKKVKKLALGDCDGNAFMSTVVAKGRGTGIVVRTGADTEIGKISTAINKSPTLMTPIQRKLKKLGLWLVLVAVILSVLVVVIGLIRKQPVKKMIKLGVSLAVSVIPEGLVTVVTITMAIGVSRMARRNAIVRKLPSVETLGSVTVICSDKTGTLTDGKMGLTSMWLTNEQNYTFTHSTDISPKIGTIKNVTNKKDNSTGDEQKEQCASAVHVQLAMLSASMCCNAIVAQKNGAWQSNGDPTEVALVVASKKIGLDKEYWEHNKGVDKINEFSFESERKLMSVVCHVGSAGDSITDTVVFAKGAPESVLAKCTAYLDYSIVDASLEPSEIGNLATTPIDAKFTNHVSTRAVSLASSGLRVLALAYRPVTRDTANIFKQPSCAEKDLVFIGLVGLIDPPRAGVRESVEECKTAGIRIMMITGDHIATAQAIARDLGIMDGRGQNNRAVTGNEIDDLKPEQIAQLTPFPVVFARVSPESKTNIVKALQLQGHSVAMTGDGVNDAPAVKIADVGVAMGVGGTEITKEAADIVLVNDDFSTIVDAVEEGRRVFDNIEKFLVYLLSCNSCEIWVMLFALVMGYEPPLTAMMVLFANIIADVPPSMALGLEPIEKGIMLRQPRRPDAAILSISTSVIITVQGFILAAVTLAVYFYTYFALGADQDMVLNNEAQTVSFIALTILQLNQGFLSRSIEASVFKTGILENRWLIGAWFLSTGLLLIGTMIRPIATFLECTPPQFGWEWLVIAIGCIVHVLCTEILKFVARKVSARRELRQNLITENARVVENYIEKQNRVKESKK